MLSRTGTFLVSNLLCSHGRVEHLLVRRMRRRKIEFPVSPRPIEEPEVDPREAAEKELAELTGGMSLDELKSIIQPHKTSSKNLISPGTDLPPSSTELSAGEQTGHLTLTSGLSKSNSLISTFNLASLVENATPDSIVRRFLDMGVNLHNIERRKGLAKYVLGLNFEEGVQPHLWWLRDQQIPASELGRWVTKNPLIFKVDLDDLQVRVNYLEAKKFTKPQIQRILLENPFWLMFSTRRIDRRLGFFQQEFKLQGNDVRFLATKQPSLITYNMEHIRKSTFVIREEMGFEPEEVTRLLLNKPRLWMQS